MGIVSLGGTKPKKKPEKKKKPQRSLEDLIREADSKNWFRKECLQCPHYKDDEVAKIRHCLRPIGEECLAESLLVAEFLFKQRLDELQKLQEQLPEPLPKIPTKKIKRRR